MEAPVANNRNTNGLMIVVFVVAFCLIFATSIISWPEMDSVERRIALTVPSYLQALRIAARTDLVAFVPRRLIGALAKQLSLATVTPPFDPGADEQFMFYPTRAQMDPGSIWLRQLMLQTGRDLDRPKRRAA